MSYKFRKSDVNWVKIREQYSPQEVDFHWKNEESSSGYYGENMQQVWDTALKALMKAQAAGTKYVLFTHGSSTSGIGKTTSRSQIRKLMQSKEATPFINRKECIQHYSVFLAAIKPLPEKTSENH